MSGRLRALYLVLVLSVWLPRARGAEWFVDIYDYYFTPTNLFISQGDTVTWINRGLQAHDTTALDGLWASELLYNEEQPFSFTFTNAGENPYICLKHIDEYPEQTGLVVVARFNLPPGVQITNPPNGGVFAAPASFILGAEASDDDSVVSVEFFLNGLSLGIITNLPYVTSVSGLGTNSYTITAIATDNEGATGTSAVNIVVQEAPPTTFTLVFSVTPPNTGALLVSPPPIDGLYFAGATVALAPQPAAGFRFAHWTGDVAPSAATNNPLLLLMNSDKNVVAVFEPIPPLNFTLVGGRYLGLLIDESTNNYRTSGFISLRVSKTGSYHGTATIGGIASVMRGQFDHLGYAPLVLRRFTLSGSLQIDPDRQRMTGFITDGNTNNSPTLTLYRTAATTNAGTSAGDYAFLLAAEAPVPNPGIGSMRILTSGTVRSSGVLGDGRSWSDRTFITPDRRIPIFTRLYHHRGAMLGWLNVAQDGTVSGDVRWFRPGDSRNATYPDGFSIKTSVNGARQY